MPKRIPKYVRHRARNSAKVTLNGKTHYLPGDYDSDQSRAEYDRLIAEYLAKPKTPETANVTIRFLAVLYMKFCAVFYVNEDGRPSEEINQVRRSLKPLLALFGGEQTNRFGPRKLKQVREAMIASGLYRNTINDRISRIVRMLSWAAEEEYLNAHIVVACREVRNLQEGRCGNVPEGEPVQAVSLESVAAVREYLGRVVRSMVDLELVTGMRPQEVRNITWGQIDKSAPTAWCYQPRRHKTKRKGKQRKIFIGPAGQEILSQFLKADPDAFIFSPQEAEAERNAERRDNRKSPMTPSQSARQRRPGRRRLKDQYTKDSYRRCIVRACEKAFDMPGNLRRIDSTRSQKERAALQMEAKEWRAEYCWSPNQLRHACGTLLRAKVGIDGARTVLGHSEKRTTEVYAARDFEQAREIMAVYG
ncbi:MAG: site-specific integrase [Fuerstiella sp.]|nr:site-specific integrase [Fuerstiella sp.]